MPVDTDFITPRRARRSARHLLLYRSLSQAGSVLALFLLLRLLSEAEYGVYSLFASVLPLLAALISLGLGNSLQRFLPELVRRREFSLVKRLLAVMLLVRLLSLGLVAVVIGFVLDDLLAAFGLSDWGYLVWPFALVVFADFQVRLLRITLSAFLHMDAANASQVTFALIKLAGYALMLWAGASLAWVFWVDVLAYAVLLALLSLACVRRVLSLQGPAQQFSADERRRMLRYSLYYSFNDASAIPMSRSSDKLMIGYFLEPVMVAAYTFAATLNHFLLRLAPVNYFYEVLRTLFFAEGNAVSADAVGRRFVLLAKSTWLLVIPVFAVLCALYQPLTAWLLAGKYARFEWLVVLMLGLSVFSALGLSVGLVAQLRERTEVLFAANVFSVYSLLMAWWLIPRLGLAGAVVATASAAMLRLGFVWLFIRRDAPLLRLLPFLLMSALWWLLFWGLLQLTALQLPVAWQQVAAGLLLALPAGFFYLRLPLFDAEERRLLQAAMGPRLQAWADRLGWFRGAAA